MLVVQVHLHDLCYSDEARDVIKALRDALNTAGGNRAGCNTGGGVVNRLPMPLPNQLVLASVPPTLSPWPTPTLYRHTHHQRNHRDYSRPPKHAQRRNGTFTPEVPTAGLFTPDAPAAELFTPEVPTAGLFTAEAPAAELFTAEALVTASRTSKESGLLYSHSHGESIDPQQQPQMYFQYDFPRSVSALAGLGHAAAAAALCALCELPLEPLRPFFPRGTRDEMWRAVARRERDVRDEPPNSQPLSLYIYTHTHTRIYI